MVGKARPTRITGVLSRALRGSIAAVRAFSPIPAIRARTRSVAEVRIHTFARRITTRRSVGQVVVKAFPAGVARVLPGTFTGGFSTIGSFRHISVEGALSRAVAGVAVDAIAG